MESLLLGMLNTPEIVLIFVLALILFGAKKLPELAKGLGHGIKEFRKASREISDELNTSLHEDSAPPRRNSGSTSSPTPSQPDGTQAQGTEYAASSPEDSGSSESEGSKDDTSTGDDDSSKSSGQTA